MALYKNLVIAALALSAHSLSGCNVNNSTQLVKYHTAGGSPICVNEKSLLYKELTDVGELASADFLLTTPGGKELLGRYTPQKYLSGPGYKNSRSNQHKAISTRGLSADPIHSGLFGVRTGYELEHLTLYHSNVYRNTRAWFLANEAASCAHVAQAEIPCHVFYEVNFDRVMVQLPYKMLGKYNELEKIVKENYFLEGDSC